MSLGVGCQLLREKQVSHGDTPYCKNPPPLAKIVREYLQHVVPALMHNISEDQIAEWRTDQGISGVSHLYRSQQNAALYVA